MNTQSLERRPGSVATVQLEAKPRPLSHSAMCTSRGMLHGLACVVIAAGLMGCTTGGSTRFIGFDHDMAAWNVEQAPGGSVVAREQALVIEDQGGCTVWLREKLVAPVEISYEVTVVAKGGPHDRVSDVNCFWMASDPASPTMPAGRSGRFADYDSLRTYYVGMGGSDNTTTRFRRYAGDGTKPLLPEYDLREKKYLLRGNTSYRIRLVARNGTAEFWRDGEKIFSYADPRPLTEGWFGIRTVNSHLEIRSVRVQR
jgi:hypothetical protein